MTKTARLESLARQCAQGKWSDQDLRTAVTRAALRELDPTVWQDIETERHHSPRLAHARARVAYEIARRKRDTALRARAELALIETLSTLGDFPAVLALCEKTAARFYALGDSENVARVWLKGATAETLRGNLDTAHAHLERALRSCASREIQFRAAWIEADIMQHAGNFKQAAARFRELRSNSFAGDPLIAARLACMLGVVRARLNSKKGIPILEQARKRFANLGARTEGMWCEYYLGQSLTDTNDFPRADALLTRVKTFAHAEQMPYLQALCNLDLGYLRWSQQRLEAALAFAGQARAGFAKLGAVQEISSSEINIGSNLQELNRYAEAIPHLENAARIALDTNRFNKAGVAHSNLGQVYDLTGDYSRALHHHLTARELFTRQNSVLRLAECNLAIGKTQFHLGQLEQAAEAFQRARQFAQQGKQRSGIAQAELGVAQIALARGHLAHARARLQSARKKFQALAQTIYVAYCEHQLAQTNAHNPAAAKHYLQLSRERFARQNLFVQVALCELTRADLHSHWKEWADAEGAYRRAEKILDPAFPDHAWRIAYGRGKIARARGDAASALGEWLRGSEMIAQLRGGIELEAWSNDLFHARQTIFADALDLACTLQHDDAALRVIEIAKAQTFLQQLKTRATRELTASAADATLLERARVLRERVIERRKQLLFDVMQANPAPSQTRAVSIRTLGALRTTLRAYEKIAQRVRLAQRGLKVNPALASFDPESFRAYANARWGDGWTALDYYFANGNLYIACVEPAHVSFTVALWNDFDRAQLKLATSTHPDERELVYHGTLHGFPVASRPDALSYLTTRLIPEPARTRQGQQTLIVAPHDLLHQLPFHALEDNGAPLLERFTFVHTPNLQALVELARNPISKRKMPRHLVVGIETFDALPPLQQTRAEVDALKRIPNTTVLWQADATRRAILEWNQRGALAKFTHLHFATHALVTPDAPHESHIALSDTSLNVLDLAEWNLNARLVTLSACVSALGAGGTGDEVLGLARAFFAAGARAVVASLWNVNDASTAQLMKCFYQNLEKGESIARALRGAQLALKAKGFSAYHWAPFVAMGET